MRPKVKRAIKLAQKQMILERKHREIGDKLRLVVFSFKGADMTEYNEALRVEGITT